MATTKSTSKKTTTARNSTGKPVAKTTRKPVAKKSTTRRVAKVAKKVTSIPEAMANTANKIVAQTSRVINKVRKNAKITTGTKTTPKTSRPASSSIELRNQRDAICSYLTMTGRDGIAKEIQMDQHQHIAKLAEMQTHLRAGCNINV